MNRHRLPVLLIKLIYSTCFFHSVFAPPDSSRVAVCLPRLNFSVKRELKKVPLVFPVSYWKHVLNEISPSLCRLFDLSLQIGTFPEKWKDANLVPIHQCESKTMVSNYRGISLLDVLSKILERQVYNEIFRIICLHPNHWQHGFLPGKSNYVSTISSCSSIR